MNRENNDLKLLNDTPDKIKNSLDWSKESANLFWTITITPNQQNHIRLSYLLKTSGKKK